MSSYHAPTVRWADLHAIFGDALPTSSVSVKPDDDRIKSDNASATPAPPKTRETTFSRPLVLHVRQDAGPSHGELSAARDLIIGALKSKERAGSFGANIQLKVMRDVELFHAALPFLRDASLSTTQAASLRKGLDTLRTVVAGSLTLGGHSARSQRQDAAAATAAAVAAAADDGGLLHEIRSSALDFHVVFGGKVVTYKRVSDTADGKGEASRRAAVAVKFEPPGGRVAAPQEVVADCVYVPTLEWERRKRALERKREDERRQRGMLHQQLQVRRSQAAAGGGAAPGAPLASPTSPSTGASGEGEEATTAPAPATPRAADDRLLRLKRNLDSATAAAGRPTTASARRQSSSEAATDAPLERSSTSATIDGTDAAGAPPRAFKAPVPPEQRPRHMIRAAILQRWSTGSAASASPRPSTARSTQSATEASHHGGATPRPPASARPFTASQPNRRVTLDDWRAVASNSEDFEADLTELQRASKSASFAPVPLVSHRGGVDRSRLSGGTSDGGHTDHFFVTALPTAPQIAEADGAAICTDGAADPENESPQRQQGRAGASPSLQVEPITNWRDHTMRTGWTEADAGRPLFATGPLVVTMSDGRIAELPVEPRADPALATRWQQRHRSTQVRLEERTRAELQQREAHRAHVIGSTAQLAAIAKRAEAAGRLWSVAHGAKRRARASIWSQRCEAMAESLAAAQQRSHIYESFRVFMKSIDAPHTYSGHLLANKLIAALSDANRALKASLVDEAMREVEEACANSGKHRETVSIEAEKLAAFMRDSLQRCELPL